MPSNGRIDLGMDTEIDASRGSPSVTITQQNPTMPINVHQFSPVTACGRQSSLIPAKSQPEPHQGARACQSPPAVASAHPSPPEFARAPHSYDQLLETALTKKMLQ